MLMYFLAMYLKNTYSLWLLILIVYLFVPFYFYTWYSTYEYCLHHEYTDILYIIMTMFQVLFRVLYFSHIYF